MRDLKSSWRYLGLKVGLENRFGLSAILLAGLISRTIVIVLCINHMKSSLRIASLPAVISQLSS